MTGNRYPRELSAEWAKFQVTGQPDLMNLVRRCIFLSQLCSFAYHETISQLKNKFGSFMMKKFMDVMPNNTYLC